jgi:hypothetical protein
MCLKYEKSRILSKLGRIMPKKAEKRFRKAELSFKKAEKRTILLGILLVFVRKNKL